MFLISAVGVMAASIVLIDRIDLQNHDQNLGASFLATSLLSGYSTILLCRTRPPPGSKPLLKPASIPSVVYPALIHRAHSNDRGEGSASIPDGSPGQTNRWSRY